MLPRVLDGGLATTIERNGHRMHRELWSAHLLHTHPTAIAHAHAQFARAGARLATTATYQACTQNLVEHLDVDVREAERLIASSVPLARIAARENAQATDEVCVAGSVGCYGACLADGSEYTGAYGATMSESELMRWHESRLRILLDAGADVIAMETIPCRVEVRALCRLLRSYPNARAWLSMACRDETTLNSGESLAEAVREIEELDADGRVCAIGVNCVSPWHVSGLVDTIVRETTRPVLVYPNAGERWDAASGTWDPAAAVSPARFGELAREWYAMGVWCVGGCCRIGPEHISQVAAAARAIEHASDQAVE